jgi:2'-5' RNA ligase
MADELRSELARFPSFTLTLSRLGRFDGSPAVVYAEPEPPEPFLAMTERLTARFGFLPYGGVHDELIPHLTLAVGDDPRVLDTIASNAARRLPISCGVDAAEVWEHAPSGWRMLHRLALGE